MQQRKYYKIQIEKWREIQQQQVQIKNRKKLKCMGISVMNIKLNKRVEESNEEEALETLE